MENEEVPVALLSICDQMQAVAQASDYPIVAIIVIAADGSTEIRSVLEEEDLRTSLHIIAEEF